MQKLISRESEVRMNKCIKCGGKLIDKSLFPCKAKVCLSCGYVEFYATKEDLKKFNELINECQDE